MVHGAGQPQNAAVPHQGRPNLAVFGNILPLEDIGHQADGDEAQNHGSGVDFRIRRGGPTDNGQDEKAEKNFFFAAHGADGGKAFPGNSHIIDLGQSGPVDQIHDVWRDQQHDARGQNECSRPLEPSDVQSQHLIRQRPSDGVGSIPR